ncbi:MAG: hypothetical protein ACRD0W_07505 [Acidimicrobiales bacterium]
MTGQPEEWERQKGESRQAFEAFAKYRDMGATRSARRVAEQLTKSETLIKRWSARWRWVARADAWDRELDRLWRAEMHEARMELSRRELKIAAGFLAKVVDRLRTIQPDQLSAAELIRWAQVATEIERRAVGEDEEEEVSGVKQAAGLVTQLVQAARERHG